MRVWSQRFAFVLLAMAAIGMIVLNRSDPAFLERFRTGVNDMATPILDSVSRPISAIRDIGADLREMTALREENDVLREKVARLERWQTVARQLQADNATFQAMLNFVPEEPSRFITARIIADSSSAFVRSVLLNAGSADGVKRGRAAISSEGLVGRVVDVGERSARVLLITDLNSRIPVLVESTRDRAVLAGNNSNQPQLLYLPPSVPIAEGDRVVTSGHGGVFPPGLPVGVISLIERSNDGGIRTVRVNTFVNWNRVEMVRIVDHDVPGLILGPQVPQQRTTAR